MAITTDIQEYERAMREREMRRAHEEWRQEQARLKYEGFHAMPMGGASFITREQFDAMTQAPYLDPYAELKPTPKPNLLLLLEAVQ